MDNSSFYGTGRRKTSVARVYLSPGNGKASVNSKLLESYFPSYNHRMLLMRPLKVADRLDFFDICVCVSGGGVSSQCKAVQLGITKALLIFDGSLRKSLRGEGFLTRDSRVVERKKIGLRKARKKPQFSKR